MQKMDQQFQITRNLTIKVQDDAISFLELKILQNVRNYY